MLKQFEEDRCQQCHSSINQFVVFEKYAEMNNKYDVKNFSELIEKFDIQAELKAICEDIETKMEAGKAKCQQTVFDPFISKQDQRVAEYKFSEFESRYELSDLMNSVKDISSMSELAATSQTTQNDSKEQAYDSPYVSETKAAHQRRLLSGPPRTLACHHDKEEILIHVLDKAFGDRQLSDGLVYQMREMFKVAKQRETFLDLIEDDYKGYGIDHRQADIVVRRCLKVKLPSIIYGNLKELFLEFLAALCKDMKEQDKEEQLESVDILLRIMMYARLFVIEAVASRARDSIISAVSGSSSSTGCTPPPSMKRMISDLD